MSIRITNSIKRRFIKDFSLPITIVEDEYFFYYLKVYEETLKSLTLWKEFNVYLEQFDSEESFFKHCYSFQNRKIKEVKDNEKFELFLNYKPKEKDVRTFNEYVRKKNIFRREFLDVDYISIDLKKANYQTFIYSGMDLPCFNDFMEQDWYFTSSKYSRQVIFGQLEPKKQSSIQKEIIGRILGLLINSGNVDNIVSVNNDEIILKDLTLDYIDNIFDFYIKRTIEKFKLISLQDHKGTDYFIKELDSNIEIKGVNKNRFIQVHKKYFNIPLDLEKDLVFYYEKDIVQFKYPIKW